MIDKQRDTDFIAYVMSYTTFFYGLCLIFTEDYLIERFLLWGVSSNIENTIGVIFIIISCIQLIGLKTSNKHMKRSGIISMCLVWAMVVGLYIFEAFDLQFIGLILTAPILVLCLRIARRGDFVE